MPGYKWTVHRSDYPEEYISATGIQTSGFNRLSTLHVTKRKNDLEISYEVKSAGFGKNTPCLSAFTDGTLARALRGLQNYYENMASKYSIHANDLEFARKNKRK